MGVSRPKLSPDTQTLPGPARRALHSECQARCPERAGQQFLRPVSAAGHLPVRTDKSWLAVKSSSEEQTESRSVWLCGLALLGSCSADSNSCSLLATSDLNWSSAAAAHLLLRFDTKTELCKQPRWTPKCRQKKESADKPTKWTLTHKNHYNFGIF